ncbi:hypothetical protein EVAR_91275_1 [Eumeta japonica]|uniref:Reverse transcriptase domain-containing protein n=1 Tax=Eumeta variegata TaxID=151549 RepID=A0A4C1T8W2_EUMVA|nr:hypothetical protein EVAR_91275_1 [Eumeta japonica]
MRDLSVNGVKIVELDQKLDVLSEHFASIFLGTSPGGDATNIQDAIDNTISLASNNFVFDESNTSLNESGCLRFMDLNSLLGITALLNGKRSGSVLAPHLYSIFMYDFPHELNDSQGILYADDSLLYAHDESPLVALSRVSSHLRPGPTAYREIFRIIGNRNRSVMRDLSVNGVKIVELDQKLDVLSEHFASIFLGTSPGGDATNIQDAIDNTISLASNNFVFDESNTSLNESGCLRFMDLNSLLGITALLNGKRSGSVLAPHLYSIFMYDFPHELNDSQGILYADDSLLYAHDESPLVALSRVSSHLRARMLEEENQQINLTEELAHKDQQLERLRAAYMELQGQIQQQQ